mmetsp:Transcript_9607/g.16879  ORF Transcript_9607/g.16879 Transcript_9607/m.16879 type:complete len:229 (+) Transcript_9607:96-782(+)
MGDEHPKIVVKQEEDSSSDGDFPDKSSGDSFNSGEGMPTETLRSRKRDRMERSRTHEQKVNDKIRTPPSQTSSERGYRNPIRRSDSDVCSNTKGSTRLPKRRCTKSVNYKEIEPSDDDHEVDYKCCSQHSGRSVTNSVKPTQRSSRSSNSSNNNNGSSSSSSSSSNKSNLRTRWQRVPSCACLCRFSWPVLVWSLAPLCRLTSRPPPTPMPPSRQLLTQRGLSARRCL